MKGSFIRLFLAYVSLSQNNDRLSHHQESIAILIDLPPSCLINIQPNRLDLSSPQTPRPTHSNPPELPAIPQLRITQPPNPLILHPLLPLLPPFTPLNRTHLRIPQHHRRSLHARILLRVHGAEHRFLHVGSYRRESVPAHQQNRVVRLRLWAGRGVVLFGEKGGCEGGAGGAGGADARDVAVGFGKLRGEGRAEVGGRHEDVAG